MDKEWSADEVLELARSYKGACVLAAAAELDLFSALGADSCRVDEVVEKVGADCRGMTILLDALVALRLVHKEAGQYTVPASIGQFLGRDGPDSVWPMVHHQANCLKRWVQLAQVVKIGKPAQRHPSLQGETADEEAFIGAMDNICAPIAPAVVGELQPLEFTHLLDVGGALGTWTIALLNARPGARATLFDLPHVIPLARQHLDRQGMGDRVSLAAGDFLVDPLPEGADLVWVSAIAHQNSPSQNRRLFSKIFAALADGGQLIIRDILMDPSRTSPVEGALFAINMLVATEGGNSYTFEELHDHLTAAGFEDVTVLRRDDSMNSLVRARKPAST